MLIIDPVTPFSLPTDPNGPAQDQARSLINLLQTQLDTTNLLTAHLTGANLNRPTGIEEYLASGVFTLKLDRSGEKVTRRITIRKIRGVPVAAGEYFFKISSSEDIALRAAAASSFNQPSSVPVFERFEPPSK